MTDTLSTVSTAARLIVDDVVYATMATAGASGRPRTRVLHPVWNWDQPVTGLVTSRPTRVKVAHLRSNPWVSLAYWSPAHNAAYLDGEARWVEPDRLEETWDRIAATPGPTGFDPLTIWPDGPTSPDFGVVEISPHRIRVVTADRLATGGPYLLWRRPGDPGR